MLTNTTYHRIGLNFVTAIYTPDQPDMTLRILPNPMSATARVELDGWAFGQRVNTSIVNSTAPAAPGNRCGAAFHPQMPVRCRKVCIS